MVLGLGWGWGATYDEMSRGFKVERPGFKPMRSSITFQVYTLIRKSLGILESSKSPVAKAMRCPLTYSSSIATGFSTGHMAAQNKGYISQPPLQLGVGM